MESFLLNDPTMAFAKELIQFHEPEYDFEEEKTFKKESTDSILEKMKQKGRGKAKKTLEEEAVKVAMSKAKNHIE